MFRHKGKPETIIGEEIFYFIKNHKFTDLAKRELFTEDTFANSK